MLATLPLPMFFLREFANRKLRAGVWCKRWRRSRFEMKEKKPAFAVLAVTRSLQRPKPKGKRVGLTSSSYENSSVQGGFSSTFSDEQNRNGSPAPSAVSYATQEPPNQSAKRVGDGVVCLTDLGNGKRFATDHSAIARYCHPWQKWLLWDGKRWRIDDTGRAMALAKQTILGLFRWAEKQIKLVADDESPAAKIKVAKVKAVLDFALKSQAHNRLKGMLDLAKSEPDIPILPDVFDADTWLLNCINGTLDLRTGTLRPHAQSDYLTKLCPVEFNPAATCPTWERSLSEVFNCSESLIGYLQRLVGYFLTGLTTEHALPILWGTGANGKSTLVGAIFDLLGADYSGKASRDE
jgi:hypothetical protein